MLKASVAGFVASVLTLLVYLFLQSGSLQGRQTSMLSLRAYLLSPELWALGVAAFALVFFVTSRFLVTYS